MPCAFTADGLRRKPLSNIAPESYREALARPEAEKLHAAMDSKIPIQVVNETWEMASCGMKCGSDAWHLALVETRSFIVRQCKADPSLFLLSNMLGNVYIIHVCQYMVCQGCL
jgi:hypothetical protein